MLEGAYCAFVADALELDSNTISGSLIMRKFKHQPFLF